MLYFDVTRLLEWKGRYTGMEHVAYALAHGVAGKDGRLVYFVPQKGFIDVTHAVTWAGQELSYSNVRHGSIKKTLKESPAQVPAELRRRRALNKLLPITFSGNDTFFTSDGLWDRQEYIDAIITVASSGTKIAHLVHDIVPVVVPHLVHSFMTEAMTSYFTQITPHIDVLVGISKNTQNDFKQAFGKLAKPGLDWCLFHHGDDVLDVVASKPSYVKEGQEFILCVGTIEIRKNHMLLYQAYKLAAERGVDLPPLVVIGREGWLAEQTLKLMRDDPLVKDKIILAGPAPDAEMVWCYQHCLFTVMPSFYEGWGLQVAQSLYFGKVAAVSSVGPLPEVGGDLNVYYSPFSVDECLKTMQLLLDRQERERREKRIKDHYKSTDWHKATQQLIVELTT